MLTQQIVLKQVLRQTVVLIDEILMRKTVLRQLEVMDGQVLYLISLADLYWLTFNLTYILFIEIYNIDLNISRKNVETII